jgi:hypothetical protein
MAGRKCTIPVKTRDPSIHHLPGSKVKTHSSASIKTTTLVPRKCISEALEVNRPARQPYHHLQHHHHTMTTTTTIISTVTTINTAAITSTCAYTLKIKIYFMISRLFALMAEESTARVETT